MTGSTISALPPAGTLTGAEEVAIAQSGNTVRTTVDDIATLTNAVVSTLRPETTALLTAILAAGSPEPSQTTKFLYDNIFAGLDAAGILSKFDALYLPALAPDEASALINFINPGTYNLTNNGAAFTAGLGFTGNGSTAQLDTGAFWAGLSKFTLNDAHMGAWMVGTSVDPSIAFGRGDTAGATHDQLYTYTAGDISSRLNSSTSIVAVATDGLGHTIATRADAVNAQLYKNGVNVATSALASDAQAGPVALLRASSTFSSATIAAAHLGASLTADEVSALYDIILSAFIAAGVSVTETLDTTLTDPIGSYGWGKQIQSQLDGDFYLRPETRALIIAMMAAGTDEPSQTLKNTIDTVFATLDSAGVLSKFDALYLPALMPDEASASINWIAPGIYNLINNGATFTVGLGFTGDGTSAYVDTGFIANSAPSPKFTLNSAHVGAWEPTEDSVTDYIIGDNNARVLLCPRSSGNLFESRINTTSGISSATMTTAIGHSVATRSSGTTEEQYKNGVSIGTFSRATTLIPSSSLTLFKASTTFSGRTVAAAHFGADLLDADVAALYRALSVALFPQPNPHVISAAGTITVLPDDTFVVVDKTTPAPTTINLPPVAVMNAPVIIKDGAGNAATDNITIVPSGTDLIDGQSSLVLKSNFQAICLRPVLLSSGYAWVIT